MSLLSLRKPKCVVVKSVLSHSGKYKIFYGHHWRQGKLCYDVGSINQANGEITSRHYWENDNIDAKAKALACYHDLEKGMTRAPKSEEKEDREFRPWEN